jgi:class 3 adenylate cyclase
MPDPQIRYARTSDGVNIAYWAIGAGPAMVIMDLPTSNVQVEWAAPGIRANYEASARVATVVRYDHRGFGLSDKYEDEFTTDAFVRDLEAVVDKLDLKQFFIFGRRGPIYPIALAYAKLHPERVIRIAAVVGGPPAEFTRVMLDTPDADWRFIIETISRRAATGWDDEETAAKWAEHARQSTDEAGFRRFVRWSIAASHPAGLHDVLTPCLFLPTTMGGSDWIDQARSLASRMPDAAIRPITGGTELERAQQLRDAITVFFTQGLEAAAERQPAAEPASGNAVILFLDIADSTALTERMGDTAFRAASRTLDERLRAAIRDAGGTPVEGKVMGDGVMAVFTSAREAIDAALRCNALSAESELRLHIGIHAGDVIREPDNVYGGAVNIASRICDASSPGEVLVSDVVRGMARTSAGVTFEDRGEREMKGVGDPVRVYAVRAENG